MMNQILPRMAMAISLVQAIAGCSAEQASTVTQLIAQAKANGKMGAATSLAASAATAQMTIFYLASALAQAASQDLDNDGITPLSGGRADTQMSYELDLEKGTGHVTGTRKGNTVTDLTFTFDKQDGNAGKAYTVTGTSGQVEGFQMFFPRLPFLYTALLGDGFQPKEDQKGNTLFNVEVEAVGSLGVGGSEVMRLSKASFSLTYPLPEQEAPVGSIQARANDGTTLTADVLMSSTAIKLKGSIQDTVGQVAYTLETSPNGDVTLQKANAVSPAAAAIPAFQ